MSVKILKRARKPLLLVRNKTAVAERAPALRRNQFSRLRLNFEKGAKIRHETLHDREYLVVPTVMITEGVHHGSGGPLLYTNEDLSNDPESWNHMPIVVYHPEANGKGVSARDPEVLETRGVGILLNTEWEAPRLKTESWLDKERLKEVDERVLNALEKGEMVEVSTGLYTDNEIVENDGENIFKGKRYSAIARNHRPDHLAILPDQKGSCSIADGAGLLRNASSLSHSHKHQLVAKAIQKHTGNPWDGPEDMTDTHAIYRGKEGKLLHQEYKINGKGTKAKLRGEPKEIVRKSQYCTPEGKVVANGDDPWRMAAQDSDAQNPEQADTIDAEDPATTDMLSEFEKMARRIKKLGMMANRTFTEAADREKKKRIKITKNLNLKETETMAIKDREKFIDKLIENADSPWREDDREFLEGLEDGRLQEHADLVDNKELDVAEGEEVENDGNKTGVKGKGKPMPKKKKLPAAEGITGNAKGKKKDDSKDATDDDEDDMTSNSEGEEPTTVEEYVRNAPGEIRDVLSEGVRAHKAEKSKLVKAIQGNKRCKFSAKQLEQKPLGELRMIANLASTPKAEREEIDEEPTANFEGAGLETDAEEDGEEPTANAAGDDLPMPDWDKEFANKK